MLLYVTVFEQLNLRCGKLENSMAGIILGAKLFCTIILELVATLHVEDYILP